MKRVYLTDKKVLAYFEKKATPEFWDRHWEIGDLANRIKRGSSGSRHFIKSVKKYLPQGSSVLEGGCGEGQIVYSLKQHGYTVIGIDYARNTVNAINRVVAELDVRFGDVRDLPIDDNSIDGYISVGVIEHYWDGYEDILSQMRRVIRDGGYLFITFPYMSMLRRLKAFLHIYTLGKTGDFAEYQNRFYQFALDHDKVINDFKNNGFNVIEFQKVSGIKGFKDEVKVFKPILQKIFDGDINIGFPSALDRVFCPFAAHCAYLILQKVDPCQGNQNQYV